MSGFAGIFHTDDRTVSIQHLEQMTADLRYRGADGLHTWLGEQIGLLFAHFHTTSEDAGGARQPLTHANNNLTIVADARIDNRDDLLAALSGYLPRQETPFTSAELILAAYERWGQSCLQKLVGDFAFAIWDSEQQTLFLARDPMGIRQLFYAWLDGTFFFSTSIRAIVAALPRTATLNENLMKAFLTGSTDMWVCQTMYQEIQRLPPAHLLKVQDRPPTPQLYDRFEPIQDYSYKNDGGWLDAFAALLGETIRCRLNSPTPVALSVSGGLDSSSIAAAAYQLSQAGETLPQLGLYSTIFDETPHADEKSYFDLIANHCAGWPATRIVGDGLWGLKEFGRENQFPLEEPDIYPLRSHSLAALRAAAADGCRVVLTGDMGEMNMGMLTYSTPEVIRGIPLKYWPREMPHFQKHAQMHWSELLLRAYIRPIVPGSILKGVYQLRPFKNKKVTRPWLTDLTRNYDRQNCPADPEFYAPEHMDLLPRLVYYHTRRKYDIVRLSTLDVISNYAGVELRHPFLDRRLVDFLLHIPQHLRSWEGVDRVMLRKSMLGILPEAIRLRGKTHHFSELTERGLIHERTKVEKLLQNSYLDQMGLLSSAKLNQHLLDFWSGKIVSYRRFFEPLFLEAWLQAA